MLRLPRSFLPICFPCGRPRGIAAAFITKGRADFSTCARFFVFRSPGRQLQSGLFHCCSFSGLVSSGSSYFLHYLRNSIPLFLFPSFFIYLFSFPILSSLAFPPSLPSRFSADYQVNLQTSTRCCAGPARQCSPFYNHLPSDPALPIADPPPIHFIFISLPLLRPFFP